MRKKANNTAIEQRVEEVAKYMVANNATVRATAQAFGVSKSTIHKDVTERLPEISLVLALKVLKVLNKNMEERARRGGEATRQKYLAMKK